MLRDVYTVHEWMDYRRAFDSENPANFGVMVLFEKNTDTNETWIGAIWMNM